MMDSQNFIERDKKDIKKELSIVQNNYDSHIYALAIHRDNDKNKMVEIPAKFGIPLSNDVYDFVRDVYHVSCFDYYEIGCIPISYYLLLNNVFWKVKVPLPLKVIKRYMSKSSQKKFNSWVNSYKDFCDIQFLQAESSL